MVFSARSEHSNTFIEALKVCDFRFQDFAIKKKHSYIYTTLSMSVDALDGLPALTFGSKENFWEVAIHHKRTSATFYARPTLINIPLRSISAVR